MPDDSPHLTPDQRRLVANLRGGGHGHAGPWAADLIEHLAARLAEARVPTEIPPPIPDEALIERLAEGHWREAWPNQGYDWTQENVPTREAHRRGARHCLHAINLAGLRLVPASTDPDVAEQAARWMHEATRQATERDKNYTDLQAALAELARVTTERDDALQILADLKAQDGPYTLTNKGHAALGGG